MQRQPALANLRWRRVISLAAFVLFACGLLAEGVFCYRRAVAWFDTLAYVSIAESGPAAGGPDAFRAAGQECFAQLEYRHSGCVEATSFMNGAVLSYSAADFATFLRFYRVKPLFTWLLTAMHRSARMNTYTAVRVICAGSFVMTGVVLWLWLKEHLSVAAASLCALCLVSSPPVVHLGRNLVPDGFSTFLLLLAAYLLLYRRPRGWGIAVLMLLPLARMDNILFVFFFAGALIAGSGRPWRRRAELLALLTLGCVAAGVALARATHALPWAVLFKRSFIAWIDPASFASTHVTAREYLQVLASHGTRALTLYFPVSILLAALALADRRSWRPLRLLVLGSAAAVAARLVVYPGAEERYYVWFFLVAAVAACAVVGQMASGDRSWFAGRAGGTVVRAGVRE